MKLRVHELAKKYGMKPKEFLEVLRKDIGISVGSHLSNLDAESIKVVDDYFLELIKTDPKSNKIQSEKNKSKDKRNYAEREQKKQEDENLEEENLEEENLEEERQEIKIQEIKKEEIKIQEIKKEEIKIQEIKKQEIKKQENKLEPEKKQLDKKTTETEILKESRDKKDASLGVNTEKTEIMADESKKEETKKEETEKDSKSKKNKNKRKKGRRANFVTKNIENSPEIIEEDGVKIIKIRGELSLGDFAEKLNINTAEIIKKLFLKGQMLTINSVIPIELAEEIALDFGVLVEEEEEVTLNFGEKFDLEIEDKAEDLTERPPVITIMGHVDHGKTSLLDAIRTTNVVEGESGGITQKIGAYQIIKNGNKITFIDTPGHEAFTDMRARGAQVTDIAILVVAADDGVMPQTIEAISHVKSANVPIIVAINKIDKPDSNPMRVKQELMEHGVVSIEWGGDVEFVEVSAKQRINLDELLDTIVITAEILELKANFKKRAKAVVIESKLDSKVGPIASVLVQEGTLRVGDVVVAGEVYGKIRALINDKGDKINKVEVSQPAEITGFHDVPQAGDIMYVIKNEQHAKRIAEEVTKERKILEITKKTISLESLSAQLEHENVKELNLILRADSRGSVEALRDALMKLSHQSHEEVAVNIIQAASGAITESDVKLAEVSNAIIIGFHVRPTTKAMKSAEASNVEIRTSSVIYHIIEDVEKALSGMLAPEIKESYLGRIEIKKVFKVSKIGNIAGCIVVDGKVYNNSDIRILRNNIVIFEGKLSSLKRFQDDVKEVVVGQECGLGVENFNDIKEGDVIEAFEMIKIERKLK